MLEFSAPRRPINWITSLFLLFTSLTALTAVPLYIWKFGIDPFQIGMAIFMFVTSIMSVTLGYHRMFAHQAFKGSLPVRLATMLFGSCAFQNSVLDWASDHRRHHKHVDHDEDPYSISKGFFWAHVGWLIFKTSAPIEDKRFHNVKDLLKDPWVVRQHKWVQHIAAIVGLVLPAVAGFIWDGWVGALGGFLIAGVLRTVIGHHLTFFINSACHCFGRQPYCSKHSARDSAFLALLTMGEGYHNFHHTFQHDYRNGVKPWEFDPTKWTIWTLSKLGLASGLRTVSPEKILLAEMLEAQRKAKAELEARIARGCEREHAWEVAGRKLHDWLAHAGDTARELEHAVAERVSAARSTLARGKEQVRQLQLQTAKLAELRQLSLLGAEASA